jgi:hypothetical protein
MRHILVLTLILVVSATWVAAQQQGTTSPGASTGQATPPGASSGSSGQVPGGQGSNIIEGCLGGAGPNFTVTDKAGTTYKLDIPQGTDSSSLSPHVGESVKVMGAVNDSGSSASAPSGSSGSAASAHQRSIQVTRIGRGSGTCPGSTKGEKPPKP